MPLSKLFDPLFESKKRVRAPLRERAEFFWVRHFYNRVIRLAPRSLDPYSTHLPILCGLSAIVQPSRVVEYGSGLVSTPTFLNRTIFPVLTSLLSFENNREWFQRVAGQIGHDPRLEYRPVDGPMKAAVSKDDLTGAELVFVDDFDSLLPPHPRRSDTIAAIAALRPVGIPVVIHDIELRHLRRSARLFDHLFRFDALNPQTAVVWNDRWDQANQLPAISRLIRRYCGAVPCDAIEKWAHILHPGC